jgi:hypothetical protein
MRERNRRVTLGAPDLAQQCAAGRKKPWRCRHHAAHHIETVSTALKR